MELSLSMTYFSDTRNDLQTVGGHLENGRGHLKNTVEAEFVNQVVLNFPLS